MYVLGIIWIVKKQRKEQKKILGLKSQRISLCLFYNTRKNCREKHTHTHIPKRKHSFLKASRHKEIRIT